MVIGSTMNALFSSEAKRIQHHLKKLVDAGSVWENLQNLAITIQHCAETAMAEPDGDILTLDEVAAYLKAGKRTVYRLAAGGEIPAFKLGGTWRFRKSDLERWIASRTSPTAFADERDAQAPANTTAAPSSPAQFTKKKSKG